MVNSNEGLSNINPICQGAEQPIQEEEKIQPSVEVASMDNIFEGA